MTSPAPGSAPASDAHEEAAGVALTMAGVAVVAAVLFPLTLAVAAGVHVVELVGRAVRWVGYELGRRLG